MSKVVCIKDEIYVFGGFESIVNLVMSVENDSTTTNVWKNITV